MNLMMWIPVAGYMLLLLAIGIYASKKIENSSDYIVAGRHLKPVVLAGTLAATGIGGGATLGVAGNTYSKWGVSAVWYGISIAVAFLLMSVVAPILRRSGVKTVPEFFRMRYGKASALLHSILTIVSMIGIAAAQLKASATVIEVMGGVDYNTALLIVAVVISLYSMMGGFWSVALTDGLQLILIFLGMGITVPFALRLAGGFGEMTAHLPEGTLNLTAGIGGVTEIAAYIILFFTAYLVGEEVVGSYYAARDTATARKGSLLAGGIALLFAPIPVVLGLTIRSLYESGSLNYGVVTALTQNAKYALPALAVRSMPPFVVGILFAGILSATMSSADSALLGAGTVYSNDIYKIFVNPEAPTEKVVAVARVSMIFVMVASFFTAIYGGNILTILAVSLALRAAGSFVPYLMGHLWDRCRGSACAASMMVGTAVYLSVQAGKLITSVAGALYPALMSSAAAYFLVSFLPERRKKKEHT